MWVGALGSIVWLGTLAVIVGHSASWAVAVIVFGLGLVALAALVARRRRPPRATPAV
jgi:membrane protein implicated in regulation of membrane protease activity